LIFVKRAFSFFKSPRAWGLAGTAMVLYFLIFVVFGRLDMSWIMPDTSQIARTFMSTWPHLPFFAVRQKDAVEPGDGGRYIYYTVPTRQFTARQLAQMGLTNAVAHPAAPK
jgi:hypothetical protein